MNEALELWRSWWKEAGGDPWVGDATDYGNPDSCFFCSSYRGGEHDSNYRTGEHDPDCIYTFVARMLGEKLVE